MRDFQRPGRSTVHAGEAMACTSHPLATLAAIDTLKSGGTAMDAAVCAAAVMAVTEPAMTGLGGDCFVLYAPKGGDKVVAYNGSGRAPQAIGVDALKAKGVTALEHTMPHCVTVPGSVAAWERLIADHGRKELGELLRPAIKAAEDGFFVTPRVAHDWPAYKEKLSRHAATREIFLPNGRTPAAGEKFQNPRLAETMKKIAKGGSKAFYTGAVAQDMVKTLNAVGGFHTMEDFARTEGEYVEPIHSTYRGYQVHECPPNGGGITTLLMLSILEGFDLSKLDPMSVERLHLEVEATRLAFADRDAYIADPRFGRIPVEWLLSEQHSKEQRARIHRDRAMDDPGAARLPAHRDTVYLCVVDRDRNVCSFINSIFHSFGSGITAPESGVLLHSRGFGFYLEPGHPNCIAGGKRPMHTIIPAMLTKDGRACMPFGVMGAHFQPVGQTHVLTNMLDFGMDPQEAIDLPRAHHYQGVVQLESGYSDEIAAGLQRMGHRTVRSDGPLGGSQIIWLDWKNGALIGGSDPRKDGMALGY